MGNCISKSCWSRKEKFVKLYDKASDQISSELDINRLVKNVRDLKLLVKNSMISADIKF